MSGTQILFVNITERNKAYQALGSNVAALEPPLWLGMLAKNTRDKGIEVKILDADVLGLSIDQASQYIADCDADLTVFVAYGQHPSASSQNMDPILSALRKVRELGERAKNVLMLGLHPSALPQRTLMDMKSVDTEKSGINFVCQGEGPQTLSGLTYALGSKNPDFSSIPDLWYFKDGHPHFSSRGPLIANLDEELDGVCWDLFPVEKYRAHNWHCFHHSEGRQPYVSIYTSLGCPFKCSFCCINTPFGGAGIRYRSPESVLAEIDYLVKHHGIKNIKFADEMFVLNKAHVYGICEGLIARNYDLNIWAYVRIDTAKKHFLEKLRAAGIHWLCPGIESGNKGVRMDVSKAKFTNSNVYEAIANMKELDIKIIGNFMFGLPSDTLDSMQETLDLAKDLNCEFANFYCTMAYPGSELHRNVSKTGISIPGSDGIGWSAYSQTSYDTLPLPTNTLSPKEVLAFRDKAFLEYHSNPSYQSMVSKKFGQEVTADLNKTLAIKIQRKILM